jgi:hypothetical protein
LPLLTSDFLPAPIADGLRTQLRRRGWWIRFQEINREGWRAAWRRRDIQREILATPPVVTDREGDAEIRVLTWRRDWINLIWALKSFYHFSETRFPLYIHDGCLLDRQIKCLLSHFPNAIFVSRREADVQVEASLTDRGFQRSLLYRRRSALALKLFDFFMLSRARTIFSIDSDIVFFRRPTELLEGRSHASLFNKDLGYYYCLSLEEIQNRFGLRPTPFINSGLWRVNRETIEFGAIETWLQDDQLFTNDWLTEQTLHGLSASQHEVALLPDTYLVSIEPGLPADLVCKHYPSSGRRLLYEEGMRRLIESGFCRNFRS